MSMQDPTAWIQLGTAVLILVAATPWDLHGSALHWTGGPVYSTTLSVLALADVVVGWCAASSWIILLSICALPEKEFREELIGANGFSTPMPNRWTQERYYLYVLLAIAAFTVGSALLVSMLMF